MIQEDWNKDSGEKGIVSKVFNEDCMKGMINFPDNFFDLAIVDPPYGINKQNRQIGLYPNIISTKQRLKGRLNSGGGKLKNILLNKSSFTWDDQQPDESYFKELFRVSKNQIIWGGNYFNLPPSRCIIVWDKMQSWENFSQVELAWTSFDKPASIIKLNNNIHLTNPIDKKIHPTQKPIKLYRYVLSKFAKDGFKILDTHMGSQSSRIACLDMGFDYWGYELDPYYFDEGNKRFDLFKIAQKIF